MAVAAAHRATPHTQVSQIRHRVKLTVVALEVREDEKEE